MRKFISEYYKKPVSIGLIIIIGLPIMIYLLFGNSSIIEKLESSIIALASLIITTLMMFLVLGFHVALGTNNLFPKIFRFGCNFFICFGIVTLILMVIAQLFSYISGNIQLQKGISAAIGLVVGAYLVKKKYVINSST